MIEKLTWFRKVMAGLGKRIYYWKNRKINLYSFNSMIRNNLKIYGKINNDDYETGLIDWSAQLEELAKNVIIEMINKPIIFGLSMESVLSKRIEDLPFLVGLIFWALLGKDHKDIWPIPYLVMEENGVVKAVVRQNSCIACTEENKLTQKDFGELGMCNVIAVVMKGILQALQDYVGNDYDITKEITKCFMRGDDYGEFIYTLTPRK
ncbi:MAG: hypothetical protein ACFFDN_41025 [Candidatus Hodarchaeota archaeon]